MRTLESRQVYANRWMILREDVIERSDGSRGTYTVLEGPEIVLVLPVLDGRFCLVEQHRHPVGRRTWEFPSGSFEAVRDGDPATTAARELREEAGLEVGSPLVPLGAVDVSPSTLSQRCRVFACTDPTVGTPDRDAGEADMTSAWFTRKQLEQMIGSGRLCDAKSLAAYSLFGLHLTAGTSPDGL